MLRIRERNGIPTSNHHTSKPLSNVYCFSRDFPTLSRFGTFSRTPRIPILHGRLARRPTRLDRHHTPRAQKQKCFATSFFAIVVQHMHSWADVEIYSVEPEHLTQTQRPTSG